jgi:hypothetical protein
MPNPTITGSSYAGEFAGKYLGAALLSADTLDKGAITILPNVKYKAAMKVGTFANLVRSADCDFDSSTSTLTLTEKVLSPTELQINLSLCKKELHSDWEAAQMGFSAFDELPPLFSDFVIARVAAEVAKATEVSIWQGSAGEGNFDGFETLLTADTTVNDVTAVTVTTSNVIAQLQAIVDAIPSGVYGKEDLTIYISQNIAKAYVGAQAALGYRDLYHVGQTEMNFQGIPLFATGGLADNTAVAAQKSNLFFGTGLLDDRNRVEVIDTSSILGDDNVRVVMRYTAGVQHGIGSDIVLYS